MKKKIHKIIGVALTLAMVLSLTVALAPVASANPGDNEWSKFSTPAQGPSYDYILADYEGNVPVIGPIVMAIDGTLYCQAYETGGTPVKDAESFLFKSEDGGYSWRDVGGSTKVELPVVTSIGACEHALLGESVNAGLRPSCFNHYALYVFASVIPFVGPL